MGKVSQEAKQHYFEQIKEYKGAIQLIIKRENNIKQALAGNDAGAGYKKLTLADESLNLVSYFTLMNSLSLSLLGVKNENYLNDARKACYKAIIYLEDVVSSYIDTPFSDYEEKLEAIDGYEEEKRLALLHKLGFSIQSVKEGFGENTKWKWSFVELEARFATVSKNMLNLKTLLGGMDPRVPGYEYRLALLALAKKLMQQAADGYRQKYELSTSRIDDFKVAISYLSALRRVNILLGDVNDSEALKKKIDIWRTKMESDSKRMENKEKIARRDKFKKVNNSKQDRAVHHGEEDFLQ